MLTHHGLALSEPMAFGLSAALTFAYIPFIKLSGMPLIAYRMPPRSIIKGLAKRLDLRISFNTFRDEEEGMRAMDRRLDAGEIVGLQTSVYWLPYFPEDMRFHFNAHNLIVYGREGDQYRISDPIFESPVVADRAGLKKARFAKGALAAKGMMYYPTRIPASVDYDKALKKAVKTNLRIMTGSPIPVVGTRGIRFLGRKLRSTAAKRDARYLKLFVGHIVRMQEEIGTGGAGFRFIYASFLQEGATLLGSDLLAEASTKMTEVGDTWRLFALQATKMCKGRTEMDVGQLQATLGDCADKEERVWKLLARFR